jgi:beta propeller repeat protein
MKNKVISISLFCICLLMLVTFASAVQIMKIGTGSNPAISGNMVTWPDNNGSIHVYDLTTLKDTTIDSFKSSGPAIYGNKIVWNDKNNGTPRLSVYDISSGARFYITQNVSNESFPAIYGNRIVWDSDGNVYMRDISTSTQTQIAVGESPDIYDTKVVYSAVGRDNKDIFMYDITTRKIELINPESSDLNIPHIYGNKVIWTNSRTRAGFIQMYDFVTKKAIDVTSDNTGNTIIPEGFSYADAGDDTGTHTAIYDDKIVYAKTGNDQFGNVGVYVYDISTGQSTPVINFPMSSNPTTPDIYDNTVVWGFDTPSWSSNTADEIYVCNLTTIATTQLSVANFTSNVTSGNVPLSVAFIDTSEGKPTSWVWDFGDGNTSTEQNPTHIYSAVGNYIINLTVSENDSTYSKNVAIVVLKSMNIEADFSTNVSKGYVPLSVQFTDLSKNAVYWSWDFGDGTFDSNVQTQQNPIHTFSTAGNYTVTLSASNYSYPDYKSATITVLEKPVFSAPIADFNANPTSGNAPLTVQFIDSSQNATRWSWDFGDRSTLTDQNPSHTYSAEGTYNANLTVSNANGETNSKTATINVLQTTSSSDEGGSSIGSGGNGMKSTGGCSGESIEHVTAVSNGSTVNKTVTTNRTRPETKTSNFEQSITPANIEQTTKQTTELMPTSPNTSGKGNIKAPGFETFLGIISLLVVFLHRSK